jgi:hypothetical protein
MKKKKGIKGKNKYWIKMNKNPEKEPPKEITKRKKRTITKKKLNN